MSSASVATDPRTEEIEVAWRVIWPRWSQSSGATDSRTRLTTPTPAGVKVLVLGWYQRVLIDTSLVAGSV